MNPEIIDHIKKIVELAGAKSWESITISKPTKWEADQIKVHIHSDLFLRWFKEYEINDRNCKIYPFELSKVVNDVKFFCVADKTEIEEWEKITKEAK